MSEQFLMSFHFDKSNASDFELIEKDENTAIDPRDNSIWKKCALYDFGWGAETGFCKQPVPEFAYMNRNEFIARLKENGISPEIVSFDSSTNDGYNIRKNKFRWEVFMRERGNEYNCMGFPSESDALQYMFDLLNR